MTLFETAEHPLLEELRRLDVDRTTPMEAFELLHAWATAPTRGALACPCPIGNCRPVFRAASGTTRGRTRSPTTTTSTTPSTRCSISKSKSSARRSASRRPGGVIADLGCGTARALVPLVRAGWRGLAIDLSEPMLDVVREKAELDRLAIDCLRANLVQLTPDLVPDESVDHALCLFSTLGMIRGRANRLAALRHMRRILRPGGRLVLHVHNLWWNLYDPGGPRWLTRSLLRSTLRRAAPRQGAEGATNDWELGDKVFPYRGVPNFFLHVFRAGELRRDLREANLPIVRWIPLEIRRRHALPQPWLLPSLRCNGWIVVCQRGT